MTRGTFIRALALGAAAALAAALATPAGATDHRAIYHTHPIVSLGANQSGNWSGYTQGSLEQNGKLFQSVGGTWTVPKASAHKKGEDEFSSTWIGIGGGCVDAGCLVFDASLIQDGTEQDVSASGQASYSAWFEVIPAPSITLGASSGGPACTGDPNCTVRPGDRVTSTISSPADGAWTFHMADLTRGWSWTMPIAYSSTEDTAEWISETPVVLDTSSNVFAALPNLSVTPFDDATTNGANAGLTPSEEIQLAESNNQVIADPSAPDSNHDGFNDCAWASTCAAPTQS